MNLNETRVLFGKQKCDESVQWTIYDTSFILDVYLHVNHLVNNESAGIFHRTSKEDHVNYYIKIEI